MARTTATDAIYEVRVAGRLGRRLLGAFPEFEASEADGATCLRGRIVDQAALHAVIARVRDLGLPLLGVRLVDAAETTSGEPE